MSLVLQDRVRETTAVTGTGSATLLGAVTGYQAFSVIGNTNTCYYVIADQSGPNWEVGIGTYSTTGPTLARTTVLASSNAGSLVNFTSGTKDVFVTQPSEKAVYLDSSSYLVGNGSYNIGLNGNLSFNSTGARILGDFSNATVTNRLSFQTSTTNASTGIYALPNGTSTAASWQATNAADPTNASKILIATNGSTDVQLVSGINGTGTYLPLSFYTNGASKMQLDTSGRLLIGQSASGANLLQVSSDASISGLTVGKGLDADTGSTAVGYQSLANTTTALNQTAVGYQALNASTSGNANQAFGYKALLLTTTGVNNLGLGHSALYTNTTGGYNVAVGRESLYSNTTASYNTAIGYQSAYLNTTGAGISAFGSQALYSNTTGTNNSAFGGVANGAASNAALYANTTGSGNSAFGGSALQQNTTGGSNVAVGFQSLGANTTASNNTAVGYQALYSNVTGTQNTAVGVTALYSNTGDYNSAFGRGALYQNTSGTGNVASAQDALRNNTTGSYNSAFGYLSLYNNSTASNNTAVGYQAGYSNTTGTSVTAIGYKAAYASTADYTTAIGYQAGTAITSGAYNCLVGGNAGLAITTGLLNTFIGGVNCGSLVTTGSRNTIIGGYNGNQGGLDIRTASNYIVLSDGDGNPRGIFDGSGNFLVGTTAFVYSASERIAINATGTVAGIGIQTNTALGIGINIQGGGSGSKFMSYSTGGIEKGSITYNGSLTLYNTTSDYRLKENIVDAPESSADIDAIKVRSFNFISDKSLVKYGFIAQELVNVAPEAVYQPENPDEMMGVDYSKLVPMMLKEIQSLRKRIATLESK